jgi:hypothetical protein
MFFNFTGLVTKDGFHGQIVEFTAGGRETVDRLVFWAAGRGQ